MKLADIDQLITAQIVEIQYSICKIFHLYYAFYAFFNLCWEVYELFLWEF